MSSHFYSEAWVAYHLRKLLALGLDIKDCSRLIGLDAECLSQPQHHRKIAETTGNRLIQTLYDVGHHARYEVREIVDGFHTIDFHKAFLLNSRDMLALLGKIEQIIHQDLSGNHYEMRVAHNKLYIYHACEDSKREYLTPQGHFAFIYKLVESAFTRHEGPLLAEVGVVQPILPGESDFSRLITPNIHYRTSQSYIAFPLKQLEKINAQYNPMVERYLTAQFEKSYRQPPKMDSNIMVDVRKKLAIFIDNGEESINIESIAQSMDISRSTLYRHLAEQNVTFTQLLEDERKTKAMRFIKETTLSMGEISDRLGYANLSAFNRAFKRWFNTNPTALR